MPNVSIHLIPFLEIVAAVVVVPVAGFYVLRGRRRRRIGEVQIPRLASLARDDSELAALGRDDKGTPARDDSEALPRGGSADRSHGDR